MNNSVSLIYNIIGSLMLFSIITYCWQKCLNHKYSFKNMETLSSIIIITILSIVSDYIFPKPIRILVIFIVLLFICRMKFSSKLRDSILLVTISELTLWISEFSFAIVLSSIYKGNIQNLVNKGPIFIILNLYITFLSFLLIKLGITKKLYVKLKKSYEIMKKNELFLYPVMIVLIVIVSTAESYMNLALPVVLLTNLLMGIIFILVFLNMNITKEKYNMINNQYQTSISSLKEYESMIDKYRVNNHENKNELMTIRNMIKAKDKNTIEYIDKLVDNKVKDNERIMYKTSKIPEGGLRATIYSKLTLMDKYKIKYTLDIANDVRTTDLINLGDDLVLNICKILGVFLDNAIDEVKKLRKKNIDIEFYIMDNYLNIDITNNFKGNLDMNRLGNKNYTTKGDGHGYGLALVNKIISENSNVLINEKSINGDRFTQTLKIKM